MVAALAADRQGATNTLTALTTKRKLEFRIMADARVTRVALTVESRAHLTSLLFEATIALNTVQLGLEAITKRLRGPNEVETLSRFATQATEALHQFDEAFRQLLADAETGNAS